MWVLESSGRVSPSKMTSNLPVTSESPSSLPSPGLEGIVNAFHGKEADRIPQLPPSSGEQ